jgi:signal transduction histidine kinase
MNTDDALPLPAFDRELSLDELLAGVDRDKLSRSLEATLAAPFRIVTPAGKCMLGGNFTDTAARVPLRVELEPTGYLETTAENPQLAIAARWVEMVLQGAVRYLMAHDLHLEAVHEDYQKLREAHAGLQASEARYRNLAEHLEQRVKEQVCTIEQAHRHLYETEKLASVGQLAAGVAHEINNPLGFIASNLATARGYVEQVKAFGETVKETAAWRDGDLDFVLEDFTSLLEESAAGAARVAAIVKDLKGFSNVDRSEEAVADLNQCLQSAANMARTQWGGGVRFVCELQDLPPVRCRPGHLAQAVLNVLKNAGQAFAGEGEIRLQSTMQSGRVLIRVIDDGVGMSDETMRRAFEPFFTTRDVGQGVGLGLTVARDIIQAHGGDIDIHSEQGKGTTVTLWLPM